MRNLFELLQKAAEVHPEKIAIYSEDRQYTYRQYCLYALQIARALRKRNFPCDKPVLVIVDEKPEDLFAFMAVLHLGMFYVPIGSGMPQSRMQEIIRTYEISCVLSTLESPVQNSLSIVELMEEGAADGGASHSEDVGGLGSGEKKADSRRACGGRAGGLRSRPAFGMFTSGSTGIPKLVLKSHQSIFHMCDNFVEAFGFGEDDIYGNQVSLEFDSSIKSIFLSLANLSSILLIPQKYFMFPKLLVDMLNRFRATCLIWSTYALKLLAQMKVFKTESLPYVRMVLFSGEIMPIPVIRYWMEHSDAVFYNVYAPTECSFNCTYYEVPRVIPEEQNSLPIGRAIAGHQVLVVDSDLQNAAPNREGEIYILGDGLALGYYGDMEKTAEVFVQNPVQSKYPEIAYRTGDVGYYDEDGILHFVGRADYQIKYLGYRIELGEIEGAIYKHPAVQGCACVYDRARQKIVAFIEGEAEIDSVHQTLERILPKYMIPREMRKKERLPLNRNHKIDRKKLLQELSDEPDGKNN